MTSTARTFTGSRRGPRTTATTPTGRPTGSGSSSGTHSAKATAQSQYFIVHPDGSGAAAAVALPGGHARRIGLVLAGRHVDHDRQGPRGREHRRLHDWPGRHRRAAADHLAALGLGARLGCIVIRRLALLALAVCCGASAAHGGRGAGHIAFTRYRFQNAPLWSEIWVANPDGSGAHRASHSAKPVEDDGAQFSPTERGSSSRAAPTVCWPGSFTRTGPVSTRFIPSAKAASATTHRLHSRPTERTSSSSTNGASSSRARSRTMTRSTTRGSSRPTCRGAQQILRRADGWSGGFESPRIVTQRHELLYRDYRWNPRSRFLLAADRARRAAGGRSIAPVRLRPSGGEWSPDAKTVLFRSTFAHGELIPGNAMYIVGVDGNGLPPGLQRRSLPLRPDRRVLAGWAIGRVLDRQRRRWLPRERCHAGSRHGGPHAGDPRPQPRRLADLGPLERATGCRLPRWAGSGGHC